MRDQHEEFDDWLADMHPSEVVADPLTHWFGDSSLPAWAVEFRRLSGANPVLTVPKARDFFDRALRAVIEKQTEAPLVQPRRTG